MLAGALALLPSPRLCAAAERPITIQVGAGPRIYNQELGLNSDLGAGIRLGLGVSERASIALDFLYTPTNRTTSDQISIITSLRALARMDLLRGPIRPYVLAGAGGVMMNFSDARDVSAGTLTGGLGISRSIGRDHFVSIEGTLDFYSSRVQYYDLEGAVIYDGPQTIETLKMVTVNVGTRF